MERILQILDSVNEGGIQSFLMNCYRNIDRHRMQFDFLVFKPSHQIYEDEIRKMGGRVFKCCGRRENLINCYRDLNTFFTNNKDYNVVHYHASSLSFVAPLFYAKKHGVKTRIIHGHSSSFIGSRVHVLLHDLHKMKINTLANTYLSCSPEATKWMYGGTPIEKDVRIIINGINVEKYAFSNATRDVYRKDLKLDDAYVIGHVGRFSYVKNHEFLLNVFLDIKNNLKNAKLLLVGDGELREHIEELVKSYSLTESIIFLGRRSDIPQLMMAMDAFVLPSKYEGFPVVAVEAQASGLPVVMSDSITKDVIVHNNVVSVSLNNPYSDWSNAIMSNTSRDTELVSLVKAGLDIKTTVNELYKLYNI